jgi:thymidylate synthase ThyX
MTTQTTPSEPTREKTGIPKNPGRRDLGLRATLVFPNREIVEKYYVPIIYTACRTCYSEQDPDEIFRRAVDGDFDPLKMQKLISSVIESGHGSTIEHVVFTFAISGVSRTLSHQLVRHRAGVAFDQQSQRYVKFKGAATMLPQSIAAGDPELRDRFLDPACRDASEVEVGDDADQRLLGAPAAVEQPASGRSCLRAASRA